MSEFLSIRNYVHFWRYFDAVHPFFWPGLFWQLKRAWLCLQREKLTSVLLEITSWGGVRIVHRGDRIAEAKPDPFALARPRFDDPVWFTDVPAALLDAPFILPCDSGGRGWPRSGQIEGARTRQAPDTS